MMLSGDTESHVNAVNTLTLHDNAYIQYNKGALNIRATGDIRWRHSEGKMYDFETLNATDFQYGLSARSRYRRLLERCPQVVQMLSLKDIASFLNVTPT